MLLWNFKTYVSSSGRNGVQAEIDRYDDYGLAQFSRAVAHLATMPKSHWDEPHAKKIKGHTTIFEVRYKADRVQSRALGYFGPGENDFTITVICTHKGNVYKPPSCFDTAETRALQVQDGTATVATLQVDGEDFPPHG